MRPIRVLFIHHNGTFSGAARSLWELISAFPAGEVEASILTPQGSVSEVFRRSSIPTVPCRGMSLFDNTRYGHYRGLRWLILLREIVRIPTTWSALRRVHRAYPQFDLIHVNEIVMPLAVVLAARWLRRPLLVHVRSVQHTWTGWPGRLVRKILERHSSGIIAIDETVRRSLPADLSVPIHVVHNGFSPSGVPGTKPSAAVPRTDPSSGEAHRPLVVAMVGNLTRVKGCREFVEAAALCKARGLAVRFVFIGAGSKLTVNWVTHLLRRMGFHQNVQQELLDTVAEQQLQDVVEFRPFTNDLAEVYSAVDAVCFPSHLDAPGRPIFEAAFFSVPSIAAISSPTSDTFVDGTTGLRIGAGSAEEIARAVRYLVDNPTERVGLGRNARELAERNFDARRNSQSVLKIYRELLSVQRN